MKRERKVRDAEAWETALFSLMLRTLEDIADEPNEIGLEADRMDVRAWRLAHNCLLKVRACMHQHGDRVQVEVLPKRGKRRG